MDQEINLKTQFEIRYTPILNFQEVYRRILSPYLRIAKFNIFNQNQINEYIILLFEEDAYQIDCRFDRIVFVSEGTRDDLKKSSGPFFLFFEILQKIKESSSFGKFTNALLAEWNLKTTEKNKDEVVKTFAEKFLKEPINFNLESYPEKDYKVTLEFKNRKDELRYEFGPFQYEKDVLNYQLNSVSKKDMNTFKNMNGLLINATYFENIGDPQFSTYKSFSKVISENSVRLYL